MAASAAVQPRDLAMIGFLIGAAWLIVAAVTELFLGVSAEQRPLEEVAEPLAAEGEEQTVPGRVRTRLRTSTSRRPVMSPRPTFAGLPTRGDPALAREVELIERTVEEAGPISREELARRLHSRFWGPGRFGRSLRTALAQGRIARRGRGTLVPTHSSAAK